SGYDFIADQITKIDKYNPQVAARLVLPMTQFKNFKKHRVDKIKSVLRNIYNQNISNDLSEILEKAIH
ncbi:MAG: aminopeptidase N C-terminal domain-containing protein, partial [Alphaproteobacteria bacterium]|nr:aminopeptidase N C-terminal domain-containing protein [Alphaproteobacteria bacterium]